MSKNIVNESDFTFRDGRIADRTWEADLSFERYSWYKELSLILEVFVSEIPKNSPFFDWFSENEKNIINNCQHFVVLLHYVLDSKRISYPELRSEMERNGYQEVMIPHFAKNIQLHPDYESNRLVQHKVKGFCSKKSQNTPIELEFPGYRTVQIKVNAN